MERLQTLNNIVCQVIGFLVAYPGSTLTVQLYAAIYPSQYKELIDLLDGYPENPERIEAALSHFWEHVPGLIISKRGAAV